MIPDYHSLMLPALKLLSDRQEWAHRKIIDTLAQNLNVSDDDRKISFAGGGSMFDLRVGWALTYLRKAGLVSSPRRAVNVISELGVNELQKNPDKINKAYLRQFDAFNQFTAKQENAVSTDSADYNAETNNAKTPYEAMASAHAELDETLASELLDKLYTVTPQFFEKLVIDLLVKMGYGGSFQESAAHRGRPGDAGIDGTIKEDKLGLDVIYIQAKRWAKDNKVSREHLQAFAGALLGQGAKKGVFITTSSFSQSADTYEAHNVKIIKIDGVQLANYMIEYNLGCSVEQVYEIKKLDRDFFEAE